MTFVNLSSLKELVRIVLDKVQVFNYMSLLRIKDFFLFLACCLEEFVKIPHQDYLLYTYTLRDNLFTLKVESISLHTSLIDFSSQ